jgi:predicted RNA-binding protein with PIN domain
MAYHYVIDGYNLLYAMPEMPSGTWEARRTALVEWIQSRRPHGRNMATVVFDSRQGLGDRVRRGDIEILYPFGQSADDWIAAEARSAQNPRALVIVTNDKGIRDLVRGTGARWMSATEFLAQGVTSPQQEREPPAVRNAITEELKKRWLP